MYLSKDLPKGLKYRESWFSKLSTSTSRSLKAWGYSVALKWTPSQRLTYPTQFKRSTPIWSSAKTARQSNRSSKGQTATFSCQHKRSTGKESSNSRAIQTQSIVANKNWTRPYKPSNSSLAQGPSTPVWSLSTSPSQLLNNQGKKFHSFSSFQTWFKTQVT